MIYRLDPTAQAILHTHSIPGVVLSRVRATAESVRLEGYEMLKIFPGITTHATFVELPILPNDQDMVALAAMLQVRLALQQPIVPAFYIRGHGLYAWGKTMPDAENIVEAVEYLLSCEWEQQKLTGGMLCAN